nr:reverse transcriptase domain-containing protein [Tanacetum cinerariifolium]
MFYYYATEQQGGKRRRQPRRNGHSSLLTNLKGHTDLEIFKHIYKKLRKWDPVIGEIEKSSINTDFAGGTIADPTITTRVDFNKQEENLRRNLNNNIRSILGSFFQNQAPTSGTLLSNTIPNLKGEMKAVTTCSGLAYEGPSVPTNSSLEKVVERETKETTVKEQPNCQGSTAHIQPPVVPTPISEPDVPKTQPKLNIPYPSRLNDQNLREKATNQMEKFFQIFHDLHFDISFADD